MLVGPAHRAARELGEGEQQLQVVLPDLAGPATHQQHPLRRGPTPQRDGGGGACPAGAGHAEREVVVDPGAD
ncbi:MAG: hypothetical protein M3P39_08610, partial [Actinomycetota bacterium]|nr:hypothetical protein [Actinomycetota bacterium]